MFNSETFSLFIATTRTVGVEIFSAIVVFVVRREKFVDRKTDSLECVARVFCVAAAFFCWYAEVISRNKHLYVSFKLNDRKYTERDLDGFLATTFEATLEATANVVWYGFAAFAQCVTAITNTAYFCTENYGIYCLYLGLGVGVSYGVLVITAIGHVV